MITALTAFVFFTWLAYREYAALPTVAPPFRRRLRRWRARGWGLASIGVFTGYITVIIALGGDDRGWWQVRGPYPFKIISVIGLGAMPFSVGMVVVIVAQLALSTYERHSGLLPDADRDLFPKRSDRAGA